MIDYDKKSLCKSQFFFKQKMGLSEETPQIARIQNEITDIWQSDVTIRTLIDPVKNGMYFKVKKFVNRLKNLSNLNSSSPNATSLINDITFFPSKFSDADTIKNEKNSLFAKFLGLFSGFLLLKVKIMSFFKNWAIKPTNPFERKKIIWDIFLFINTLILLHSFKRIEKNGLSERLILDELRRYTRMRFEELGVGSLRDYLISKRDTFIYSPENDRFLLKDPKFKVCYETLNDLRPEISLMRGIIRFLLIKKISC